MAQLINNTQDTEVSSQYAGIRLVELIYQDWNRNKSAKLAMHEGIHLTDQNWKAYNQSPEAVAFFEFTRAMLSYNSIIAKNTTLVFSTDNDLFKFLKGMSPNGKAISVQRSGDIR